MEPEVKRNRLFAEYDRGVRGPGEVRVRFVEMLLDANDDNAALLLCHDLPVWFREQFRKHLNECQTSGFGRRWACIGDSRTMKEIESDAKRHGEILERLAPEILQML